jgi:hypothetical protein
MTVADVDVVVAVVYCSSLALLLPEVVKSMLVLNVLVTETAVEVLLDVVGSSWVADTVLAAELMREVVLVWPDTMLEAFDSLRMLVVLLVDEVTRGAFDVEALFALAMLVVLVEALLVTEAVIEVVSEAWAASTASVEFLIDEVLDMMVVVEAVLVLVALVVDNELEEKLALAPDAAGSSSELKVVPVVLVVTVVLDVELMFDAGSLFELAMVLVVTVVLDVELMFDASSSFELTVVLVVTVVLDVELMLDVVSAWTCSEFVVANV